MAAVFKYPAWLRDVSVYVHLGHKIHLNLKFMHDYKEGFELGEICWIFESYDIANKVIH